MQVKAKSPHDTIFPMALKRTSLEIPEASLVPIHFLHPILIQLPLTALTTSQGYEDKSTTSTTGLLSCYLANTPSDSLENTDRLSRRQPEQLLSQLGYQLARQHETQKLSLAAVSVLKCVNKQIVSKSVTKLVKSCFNAGIAFKYLLVKPFCEINSTVSLCWASQLPLAGNHGQLIKHTFCILFSAMLTDAVCSSTHSDSLFILISILLRAKSVAVVQRYSLSTQTARGVCLCFYNTSFVSAFFCLRSFLRRGSWEPQF